MTLPKITLSAALAALALSSFGNRDGSAPVGRTLAMQIRGGNCTTGSATTTGCCSGTIDITTANAANSKDSNADTCNPLCAGTGDNGCKNTNAVHSCTTGG